MVLDRKGRAMANKGSSLATGAYLATNDYLVSASGLYFVIMQGDGNMVVTKGTGVPPTVLWSAQPLPPSSQPTVGHPNLIHVGDQDFQSKVLSSPTVVIVDFWASWDGGSRSIAPVFEKLSDAYQGKLLFAKLDIDANEQTPMRYNIQSIPTLLIFKDGQEISRIVGPEPARLQSLIDRAIAT
jgi:thioredoxin 1